MRRLAPVVALLAAGLILTGCGSDNSTAPSSAPTSQAPEEVTTDATTVATGLGTIEDIAANLVTSIEDKTKATGLDAQIEPVWSKIEGTVKANDSDTYIALEDAFAVLEDAASNTDATKAASGSASVSEAVTGYLAKYPAS